MGTIRLEFIYNVRSLLHDGKTVYLVLYAAPGIWTVQL